MGVQHVYKSDEDLFWPCELAASSFSMADGRKKISFTLFRILIHFLLAQALMPKKNVSMFHTSLMLLVGVTDSYFP